MFPNLFPCVYIHGFYDLDLPHFVSNKGIECIHFYFVIPILMYLCFCMCPVLTRNIETALFVMKHERHERRITILSQIVDAVLSQSDVE